MSSPRKLAFPAALVLVIGLAIGAAAAFALRQGGTTVTGQTDPCYGLGELIRTFSYTVSEEFVPIAARDLGLELTPGEVREARECRISEFEVGTVDGASGKGLGLYTDWGAIVARATERAQETPEAPQDVKEHFVPSNVAQDQRAPCDPSWLMTTLPAKQARICHPENWTQQIDDDVSTWFGSETVSVGVFAPDYDPVAIDLRFDCEPELVNVASGSAGVCASPVDTFGHQAFGVIMPTGRKVGVNVLKDATEEEKQIAFRVAVNVEDAP